MLCPVDLAMCHRPECQSGLCARADAAVLAVCWECGSIEDRGVIVGICAACIAAAVPAPATEG
jgi:hypothetical protein